MNMVASEFATPVLLSRFLAPPQSLQSMLEFLDSSIESDLGLTCLRGQETAGVSPPMVHSNLASAVAIHRAKLESRDDLHERGNPALRELLLEIIKSTQCIMKNIDVNSADYRPYVMNCWVSSYRCGDYHLPHIHPGAVFAAVYCVETPALAAGEGSLVLHDPRQNIGYAPQEWAAFVSDARMLQLRVGDIVVFPGWLSHSVTPFRGTGRRLTVSVNLGVKPLIN